LTDTQTQNEIDFDTRKEQAIELGVEVKVHMTKNCLENEIVEKLDLGMENLKAIIDDINHL